MPTTPLVPGLVRQHQAVVLLPPGQHGQALVKDLQLHRLALAVELAQVVGHALGLVGVVGEDELHRHGGLAHAPGGVEPGGEAVAHRGGVDGPVQGARLHHQGVQPPAAGLFQVVQAHPDDGAVLPQQLHHIGHRAHGGQVGVLLEEGVVVLLPSQGHHQLQGHPHAGQFLEGVGAVPPVGVHHRHGGGEGLLALVVVGDDHVDPQLLGVVHLLHGGDAAVHGDDEAHPLAGQVLDGLPVDPVPLGEAVGDIIAHVPALAAQVVGEQGRGGDAVHVIVAIHGDFFSVAQRPVEPGHGQVHVLHPEGVLQLVLPAGEEDPHLVQVGHPSGAEGEGHQKRDPLPLHFLADLLGSLRDIPLLILHPWDLCLGKFNPSNRPSRGGRKKNATIITA